MKINFICSNVPGCHRYITYTSKVGNLVSKRRVSKVGIFDWVFYFVSTKYVDIYMGCCRIQVPLTEVKGRNISHFNQNSQYKGGWFTDYYTKKSPPFTSAQSKIENGENVTNLSTEIHNYDQPHEVLVPKYAYAYDSTLNYTYIERNNAKNS